MRGSFTKMHGLGNDFVIIDARDRPVEMNHARARAIADRRTGIGCDQLVLMEASDSADVRIRFFNHDGSPAEACGNAFRAIALLLGGSTLLETDGGLVRCESLGGGQAMVDVVNPRFGWDEIPLSYAMDTAPMPVAWEGLEAPYAVNVGNPHAIFFVEADCDTIDLARLGPMIEEDSLFPERVNVNVATVIDDRHIKLRVWERGAGLTLACGTGACATAVAAIKAGKVLSPVTISQPGGTLQIAWEKGGSVRMTGPATLVYTGEADWSRFG